jgi:hypothetical protein
MINPKFQKKHANEAEMRNVNLNEAWDEVDYIDLDVDDDFIQKALAIRAGEDYDTRIQVEVDFSDDDLLQYMKLAHSMDITFNELVERALREAIDKVKSGQLTKADAQKWLEEQDEDKVGQ